MIEKQCTELVYVGREQLILTILEKRNAVNLRYYVTREAVAATVATAVAGVPLMVRKRSHWKKRDMIHAIKIA